MILTVTVHSHCAPQTAQTAEGPVIVQPGESVTAEFDEAQEAYIRACPGHFAVHHKDLDWVLQPSIDALAAAIEADTKPRRGRPRKVA